jgi:hypothetical protein
LAFPLGQLVRQALSGQAGVSDAFLHLGCRPGKLLFSSVETILKGKEAVLPQGIFFHDKDGHVRNATRVRWYLSAERQTYREYSLTDDIPCDVLIERDVIEAAEPYPALARPVFFGHFWMTAKRPGLLAHNVACLDYSVARPIASELGAPNTPGGGHLQLAPGRQPELNLAPNLLTGQSSRRHVDAIGLVN